MINKKLYKFYRKVSDNFFSTERKFIDKEEFFPVIDKFHELQVDYDFTVDTCYFYYKPLLQDILKLNNVDLIDIDLLEKYFDYNEIYIIVQVFGNFPIDINKSRFKY